MRGKPGFYGNMVIHRAASFLTEGPFVPFHSNQPSHQPLTIHSATVHHPSILHASHASQPWRIPWNQGERYPCTAENRPNLGCDVPGQKQKTSQESLAVH